MIHLQGKGLAHSKSLPKEMNPPRCGTPSDTAKQEVTTTYEGLEKVSRSGNLSLGSTAAARMQISATQVIQKHALQTPSSLSVRTSAGLLRVVLNTNTRTTVRRASHEKQAEQQEKTSMLEVRVQPKQQHVTSNMLSYQTVERRLQCVGKKEEATCYAVATLIYTKYVRARKHARAMSDDGLLNK
jgi:hypothetical protein